MSVMERRLTNAELNQRFITGLGDSITFLKDQTQKPFLVDVKASYAILQLRVYLYNCTNPPGGRSIDEYKTQIIVPGQKKGMKGNFDYSGNRIVIFGAFVPYGTEQGVFVLYDPMCHTNFSFSANVQVKSSMIAPALCNVFWESKKTNGEIIITCSTNNLLKAIERRIEVVSPALM